MSRSNDGATPAELVIEACRRNNSDLLEQVIADIQRHAGPKDGKAAVATILNQARDGTGSGAVHLAASRGSYEVLDVLLDQVGLEIDNADRREKDTPLHSAVRHVNGLAKEDWPAGLAVVDILLDAGCDPRLRNKARLKPIELADPRNSELRKLLQKSEYTFMAGGDVVVDDGDDTGPTGSASDSD